jgi:hypothetical protein
MKIDRVFFDMRRERYEVFVDEGSDFVVVV